MSLPNQEPILNRRQFLLGMASLALSACTHKNIKIYNQPQSRTKPRYFVATPSIYWARQDLKSLFPAKHLHLNSVASVDLTQAHTVITSVNHDGTDIRKIVLPMRYHCLIASPEKNLVYVIGNHWPTALIALDAQTLEIVNFVSVSKAKDEHTFAGHGVVLSNENHMAIAMNGT